MDQPLAHGRQQGQNDEGGKYIGLLIQGVKAVGVMPRRRQIQHQPPTQPDK